MYKIIALVLLGITFLFSLFVDIKHYLGRKRPIPEEVNDVYDHETYHKWMAYSADKTKVKIISSIITFAITFTLIITDVYSLVSKSISNSYLSTFVVLGIYVGINLIIGIIFDYIYKIRIEGKYGFNNSTSRTFIGDCIRKIIITVILFAGLTSLFICIYEAMGDYILILFSAIVFAIILIIAFLYPLLSKVSNRFMPLEEGELRTRLIELLTKNGYQVRDIKVMDASRRTAKSNAYFTGFGKTKTIVLYDNMLKALTDDEIVAVFAHEMGHGLHKDTTKRMPLTILMILILVALAWLLVKFPVICQSFGFNGVNYGFAVVLLFECLVPVIMTFLNIPVLILSRRAEYKADEVAVNEGYGEQLITGLKKLTKENLADLNPDPLVVALSYSHPTLNQRIQKIRKK
jgi:STE24 endopeptidase